MNTAHLTPFLDAMHDKNTAGLGEHLRDDVTLASPFVSEPFRGREAVLGILDVLLRGVDEFTTTAVIAGERRAAVMLHVRAGQAEVTGVDDLAVDEDGLIASMSVQWRPLDQIVAIQQKLAPLAGIAPLRLSEMPAM